MKARKLLYVPDLQFTYNSAVNGHFRNSDSGMIKVFLVAVLIAGLAFFAALIGMELTKTSQPGNEQITDQAPRAKPANETVNQEKSVSWRQLWQRTTIDPVAFFTLILAIFSGGLLLVAALQIWLLTRAEDVSRLSAEAAKNSAEISREALITSQRAYVRAAGFPWLWRPDFDRPGKYFYDITPTLENAGNTPTVGARINVNSVLRDQPLPDDFDFPYSVDAGDTVIGSRQTVGASNAIILDEDLLAVQKGTKFFYIWGQITYHDVFTGTPLHTTKFCTQVIRVMGDPLDPRELNDPKGTSLEIYFRIYPKNNVGD